MTQPYKEIAIDAKTGLPRQAGAALPEGQFIKEFKHACEQSLFAFGKGVMGRDYLTDHLHLPVCQFLQKTPPFRKMLLMPRDHAKTSLVSHCLPAHILIQPAEGNVYFPGVDGSENRILLSGESATRAESNLRVIRSAFESNQVLRALWPERVWQGNPKKFGQKWSDQAFTIPRQQTYPDPSVYAVGVGGAITGSRPTVIIKDDLVSLEAANSQVVMRTAIEWHKASRALMEEYEKDSGLESLEFIIGTRWAVHDLYSFVLDGDQETPPDYSVEVLVRKIVEKGKSIWPERFNKERVAQLKSEFGSLFYLLYMNDAADPSLVDFDTSLIRLFELKGGEIHFEEDSRDSHLRQMHEIVPFDMGEIVRPGQKLNQEFWDKIKGTGRGEFLRFRYG